MKQIKFKPFTLIYGAMALATAQHTAWTAASVFQGAMPNEPAALAIWWGTGLVFAGAIDYVMYYIGAALREGKGSAWLLLPFVAAAFISAYTQVLYGVIHTSTFIISQDVPIYWRTALNGLIEARVILLPLALPLLSLLYTATGLGHNAPEDKPETEATEPFRWPWQKPAPPTHMTIEHIMKPQQEPAPPAMQAPPARERLPLAMNTRKLPSGASGRAKTGELDNAVTERDGGYVATCPRCDREFSKPTRDAARNSLTAHLRSHVQVLEDA